MTTLIIEVLRKPREEYEKEPGGQTMDKEIKSYVKACDSCQKRKTLEKREKLHPTCSTGLFRVNYGRYKYIISAHEDLTGWPEYAPSREIKAKNVAKFIEQLVGRYAAFEQATMDGGPASRRKPSKHSGSLASLS